jgi:hypothetical protein
MFPILILVMTCLSLTVAQQTCESATNIDDAVRTAFEQATCNTGICTQTNPDVGTCDVLPRPPQPFPRDYTIVLGDYGETDLTSCSNNALLNNDLMDKCAVRDIPFNCLDYKNGTLTCKYSMLWCKNYTWAVDFRCDHYEMAYNMNSMSIVNALVGLCVFLAMKCCLCPCLRPRKQWVCTEKRQMKPNEALAGTYAIVPMSPAPPAPPQPPVPGRTQYPTPSVDVPVRSNNNFTQQEQYPKDEYDCTGWGDLFQCCGAVFYWWFLNPWWDCIRCCSDKGETEDEDTLFCGACRCKQNPTGSNNSTVVCYSGGQGDTSRCFCWGNGGSGCCGTGGDCSGCSCDGCSCENCDATGCLNFCLCQC